VTGNCGGTHYDSENDNDSEKREASTFSLLFVVVVVVVDIVAILQETLKYDRSIDHESFSTGGGFAGLGVVRLLGWGE
jgi:hypothetical protein